MLSALHTFWLSLSVGKRFRFSFIVLLMAFAAMLEMAGIGALLPIISFMQSPERIQASALAPIITGLLGTVTDQAAFIAVVVGLLLFFLAKNAFLVLLDVIQYRFLTQLQAQLSEGLIASYLRRPYAYHLQANTSQIVRNVTTEVDTVFYYVLDPVVTVLAESLVIAALFVLLVIVNPSAALLLIATGGGLILAFYRVFRRRMISIGAGLQESTGKMIQYAQEGLGGVKEIKVVGREAFFERAFSRQVAQYSRHLRRAHIIHNLPPHVLETIFILVFVAVLIGLARVGKVGDAIPLVGLYAAAGFRLIPSLNRIMTGLNRLKQGSGSLRLVMSEIAPTIDAEHAPIGPAVDFMGQISLKEVRFRYPGSESESLKGVSLEIRHGERIGFVGRSGSGKTTLIDCLIGLLAPTGGTILVDGKDIQGSLRSWRRQIGYVPQNIFLTDDSLRRNVALGVDEAEIDDGKIWRALQAAQLAEFVRSLPDGLDASVGERGVRLSGGQRQRIGIARALYHEPSVLVMDEATSALDGETEKAVVDTIGKLERTLTVLVIAHRLTTLAGCDRIYHLEKGVLFRAAALDEVG